jgi:hypothetical protein
MPPTQLGQTLLLWVFDNEMKMTSPSPAQTRCQHGSGGHGSIMTTTMMTLPASCSSMPLTRLGQTLVLWVFDNDDEVDLITPLLEHAADTARTQLLWAFDNNVELAHPYSELSMPLIWLG